MQLDLFLGCSPGFHPTSFSDQPLSCADHLVSDRTTLSTAYARDGPRRLVMSDNTSHIHARVRCDDLFFFFGSMEEVFEWRNVVDDEQRVSMLLHHINYSL